MTLDAINPGDGYTCPQCKGWVSPGIYHYCNQRPAAPVQSSGWVTTIDYSWSLNRIATALERIAAALESDAPEALTGEGE